MVSNDLTSLHKRIADLEAEVTYWKMLATGSTSQIEQRFRAAAEASMDSLFIYEAFRNECGHIIDFIIVDLNTRAETLGMVKRENVIGKRVLDVFPRVRDLGLFEQFVQVVESGQSTEYEYDIPAPHFGITRFFHQQVLPMENGLALMVREITDRKQIELQLQRSEELYRTLLREFPNGAVILYAPNMKILLADGAALLDMHLDKHQLEGQPLEDIFTPGIFDQHAMHYRLALEDHSASFELTWNKHTYRLHALPVKNADGHIFAGMVMFQDITAHKYTEEKLRQALDENQAIFQALPDPYLRFNRAGQILNLRTSVETKQNMPADMFANQSLFSLLPTEVQQQFTRMLQRVIATRQPAVEHYAIPLLNQSQTILEFRVSPLLQDQAIAVIRDITDVILREKQLNRTLAEKEVLLKEVYHRVKNNLQVVCSLLSLESKQHRKVAVNDIFEDMRNRIQAMALVHEKLYGSADLNQIDFMEYTRELTQNLLYSHHPLSESIHLKFTGTPFLLRITQAIPCSLMLNELVSNCLKHAFPGQRDGEITIHFEQDAAQFMFQVQDNGIGWPANFQPHQSPSLGLKLLYGLSLQLDGNITFTSGEHGQGCLVTVIFGDRESI